MVYMYIPFLKQGNLSISIIKCNNYTEFSYFPQIVKYVTYIRVIILILPHISHIPNSFLLTNCTYRISRKY